MRNFVFFFFFWLSIRTQKLPEKGQFRQIYQPRTWARVVHDSSKKGRRLSAEVKTVPSTCIPGYRTIPMPINHFVPSQFDMNLCGKNNNGNMIICRYQTFFLSVEFL
jgi:hypothetical protein